MWVISDSTNKIKENYILFEYFLLYTQGSKTLQHVRQKADPAVTYFPTETSSLPAYEFLMGKVTRP